MLNFLKKQKTLMQKCIFLFKNWILGFFFFFKDMEDIWGMNG